MNPCHYQLTLLRKASASVVFQWKILSSDYPASKYITGLSDTWLPSYTPDVETQIP